MMHRIFGPVPSRRLGRSLGIDVVPYKTCSFDCIYCECGTTTDQTLERRGFYPLEGFLDELRSRLGDIPQPPDVLTLSGAGEPTLYSGMGELIRAMKRIHSLPVAVITNSSTMHLPGVRNELMRADIVLPSLDTALDATFQRINRPHPDCSLGDLINGLETFTHRYDGRVFLEILLIDGFNTDERNLNALRDTVRRLRVDRIQLNTAVRPGTVKGVRPVATERLEDIASIFGPRCEVVVPASMRAGHEDRAVEEMIISLLKRRPCTAEDIHSALGIPVPAVVKIIAQLINGGTLEASEHDDRTYYTARERG